MNRRAFVSGLAVAALAGVAPLPAAADGKRVALVIGNGAYRSVPALTNPPTDAGDIAAALKRLGFVGSDHFPMYLALSYEPALQEEQPEPEEDADDREQADKMLEEQAQEEPDESLDAHVKYDKHRDP